MGIEKEKAMVIADRGFKRTSNFICADCIGDVYLQKWIKDNADCEVKCNYCGIKSACVSMEKFMYKLMECINTYYGTVEDEGVIFDAETGQYEIEPLDRTSLIDEINVELQAEDKVVYDLYKLLADKSWCARNPYGQSEYQVKEFSWEHFSELVKYESRYFFFTEEDNPLNQRMSPIDILSVIADETRKLKCIKDLPAGTVFYRAHILKENENFEYTDSRLGSPPAKFAQINRMSDAGISVFYAADSTETAIKEVVECNTKKVVVAEFKNLEPIKYLDLTDIDKLETPSFFDISRRAEREKVLFLKTITSELTRTIDEQENIEYVPTQIFAEYYRAVEKVDGIKYSSAQDKNGSCYVLFFNNEQCCKKPKSYIFDKQKLELSNYKTYRLKIKFDYQEIWQYKH